MKTIINLLVVFSMLLTMSIVKPILINAEDINKTILESNSKYFANYKYVKFGSNIRSFTFYSHEDGIEYLVINDGNIITLMNNKTKRIITRAFLQENSLEINKHLDNNTFDSTSEYENWTSFGIVLQRSLRIERIEQLTISAIVGLLTAGLSWAWGWAAGELTALAIDAYNNNYGIFYERVFRSTNIDCTILVKEYSKIYSNSMYTNCLKTSAIKHNWLSTPWDYITAPYACRILVETYP